jgi:putative ABC transport system substrate-binding protein
MTVTIGRRELLVVLGGAAVAWPLAAGAEQGERIRRIGVLMPSAADDPEFQARITAFLQGLAQLGWLDGRNVRIDSRWGVADADRIRKYAAELLALAPDVILANSSAALAPLLQATRTVPIVFTTVVDPVGAGYVDSLARPGGNATGINFFNQEVASKRLRLLHELVPNAVRVAVLINPANASATELLLRIVQEAAPTIGLQIQILNATTIGEIDAAFATIERERPDALFVSGDAFFVSRAVQLATLTARSRIPATFSLRDHVAVGGLMSYGTDFAEAFRQVGVYTGKILKGAKPTDLPVTQSTKFELVINLQTARSLGIEVPPGVLSIVDEVIE